MKVKNEIYTNGFQKALSRLAGMKLEVEPAFQVMRLFKEVEKNGEIYEKTRMKLVDKYAKKDKKGNYQTVVNKDGQEVYEFKDQVKFEKEFEELKELTQEYKVKKIRLPKGDKFQIAPIDLILLEEFIDTNGR